MTREEAIYRLKNTAWLGSNEDRETTEEAVNMAISALSAEPQNCWNCKHYEPKHDVCHAPELVKQVTSKLKKPCDSLLTDDKDDSKEHKSKLDGDLISRADAIEAVRLETAMRGLLGRGDILDILFALPSAEAEWIPCSERLPSTNEVVIMSYKTTDKVHVGKYLDDGSKNPWWSYIDDCCAWNNVVTAWMPLPTPYKGGDTE